MTVREDILEKIRVERDKQISKGYDLEHDKIDGLDLNWAAVSYASPRNVGQKGSPAIWPWGEEYWKPGKEEEDLVKAAALIVARLEVLHALGEQKSFKDKVQANLYHANVKSPLRQATEDTPLGKVCSRDGSVYSLIGVKQNTVVESEDGRYVTFLNGDIFEIPLGWLGNEAIYWDTNLIRKGYPDTVLNFRISYGSYNTYYHLYNKDKYICDNSSNIFDPNKWELAQ